MSPGRFLPLLLFFNLQAFAYTLTRSEGGSPVRLRYGQKLMLAGNPDNQSGLTPEFFRSGVVFALQQWSFATGRHLDFDYWQGTDPSTFPAGTSLNGLSSISFSSKTSHPVDSNVIGYTQVWFNPKTGDILESDVILNDTKYNLTGNPQNTSSQSPGPRPLVYLNSVLTHELGHAAGMGHSGDPNSSMLFVEFLEQYRLGCDDVAGVRHLYGATVPAGSLSGQIASASGLPVAGAQITALSRGTGLPAASAVTDQSGEFYFGALEAGSYALEIAPYPGPASSLSPELTPKNREFCGGGSFPVQFLTAKDGHTLLEFTIEAGKQTRAGFRTLHCNSVVPSGGSREDEATPWFFVDSGSVARPVRYSFQASGDFEVATLASLLLSPVRIVLEAFDSKGARIPVRSVDPLYSSESGFKITEGKIQGRAFGKITIQATPVFATNPSWPGFSLRPAENPFFVLRFSPGFREANPRCLPEQPFPEYQSPAGDPPRYSTTESARERFGFCGTPEARASSLSGARSAPPPSGVRILGWFWPFFWIAAFQLNSIRRRARLKKSCGLESSRS
jgi:hypothetical protein